MHLSLYFGLAAGTQRLHVSSLGLVLPNNMFASCVVVVSASGGNAYGGAISLYIGAYLSVLASNVAAAVAAGDSLARNVSVSLHSSTFDSCRAVSFGSFGANVYGGSFSFYVGFSAVLPPAAARPTRPMSGALLSAAAIWFV